MALMNTNKPLAYVRGGQERFCVVDWTQVVYSKRVRSGSVWIETAPQERVKIFSEYGQYTSYDYFNRE
jgi:hypothetical protein